MERTLIAASLSLAAIVMLGWCKVSQWKECKNNLKNIRSLVGVVEDEMKGESQFVSNLIRDTVNTKH